MHIGGNPYCCNPYWHKLELRPNIWLHTRNLDVLAEGRYRFFVHKVNNRNDWERFLFFFSSDCRFALRIIYGFVSLRNRGKCDTVETAGATALLNGNTMIRFSLGEPGYDF